MHSAEPLATASKRHDAAKMRRTNLYSRTYFVATFAFLALALLDTFEPDVIVSAAWWIVLLLVWTIPWPRLTNVDDDLTSTRALKVLHQVGALVVFAWLFYRANCAIRDSLSYWFPLRDLGIVLMRFSMPIRDSLIGIAIAVMIGIPLQRSFRKAAVAAAFVIWTPWFVLHELSDLRGIGHWTISPRLFPVYLFDAVIAALFLMQVTAMAEHRWQRRSAPHTASAWRSHFDRLLRGNAGLWRTTGTFSLSITFLIWCISSVPHLAATAASRNSVTTLLLPLLTPLSTLLATAAAIAMFRALRRSAGQAGFRQLIVVSGMWAVSILLLGPLWAWTVLHTVPIAGDRSSVAITQLFGSTWTTVCDSTARTLHLNGEYVTGVAADFDRALNACKDVEFIELEGGGGEQGEALAMASAIEARNLSTRVTGACFSACTVVFAAGQERLLTANGALGFHAGRSHSVLMEWSKAGSGFESYLLSRGINADFIDRVTEVPHEDMWYPTTAELLAAGFVTSGQ